MCITAKPELKKDNLHKKNKGLIKWPNQQQYRAVDLKCLSEKKSTGAIPCHIRAYGHLQASCYECAFVASE